MEKISFSDIFLESWHLSFADRKFFFFGFLIAIPLASQFLVPITGNTLNTEALIQLINNFPLTTLILVCLFVFLNILGKSSLVVLLSSTVQSTKKSTLARVSIWKNAKKVFILDFFFAIFLAFLIILLGLPSLISLFLFSKIQEVLILFGTLVFIFIAIPTLFIYEFSLLYFLLSPLKLFTAIERGYVLFHKYSLLSFFFGFFNFFFSLIFTFLLNLVMLSGVVLIQRIFQTPSESMTFFFISLCFLTWFSVFNQALWLNFFIHLATSKNTLSEKTPETILKESAPETPLG